MKLWILHLVTISLRLASVAGSFPENSPAISITGVHDVPNSVFTGGDDDSQRLHYVQDIKMVKIAGKDYFAVTGRDKLFLIVPEQLTQVTESKIPYSEVYTWKTNEKAKSLCVMKGQSDENCGNYIRVVEQMDVNGNKLLICGTNSYEPKCLYLSASMTNGRLILNETSEPFSGTEKCPFGPDQSGASLYTGNSLYSAAASDFNGRSHTITRSLGTAKQLRTPKLDDKFLNEPRFVKMVDDGDRVLVFMNELVKSENGDVRMLAYLAQVCKNDVGGQHVLVRQWTKFEKTRLNCSWNGFYFDQLQDVSDPVIVKTSAGHVTQTIYATFTTPEHSVPGSAVCAFTLDSIHDALLGKFRDEHGSMTKKSEAPSGRMHPGRCPSEKYTNPELMFLKAHPLLEDQAKGNLLTTYVGERWTAVSVDTEAGPDRNWTVYFVGTDHGQVLRYLSPTGGLKNAVLLKRQDVYDANRCQNATGEVDRAVDRIYVDVERDRLLVAFKYCVISAPLRSCAVHKCKRSCLASADPYCGWDGVNCVDHVQPSARVEQDIFTKASKPTRDVDSLCLDEGAPPKGKDPTIGSSSKRRDGDDSGAEVSKGVSERSTNGSSGANNTGDGDGKSPTSDSSSITKLKIGGMSIEIAAAIGLALCILGFVAGLCVSKVCCKKGGKSTDIEKQQEAMNASKLSLTNNKDSLCKKIIASISPKRKRRGSMKPPSLSQSQSTIAADNQQGEPLFSKEHSKLDEYVLNQTVDRYVNMPTLPHSESKHTKSRLSSTGSGSQVAIADSAPSYTSRRRGSAQHIASMSGTGKKAVPNVYSTAPRIRHHSGNRTSDPSEYMNPPTLRSDKPIGRMNSRHSTPVMVSGYPTTPNSLKDYSFTFQYDQVVQSTEHVLDDVKEVIEQQQRRSAEMETLVEEESNEDHRRRHQSSDSGKGSSPRNSLQTAEEQDTVSTLSRNKPDNLVLGPPPARGRKRLNSEPTSPTSSQPPLPPASAHKPVGRSTSMRSQYANVSIPSYPPSRTRSESFSSHHSQQSTGSPMKMHQMPNSAFIGQGQPTLYATLPINPQMNNPNTVVVPQPEKYSRQMSYDTYSPMRYPSFIDHSDHPAMNMPDRFSSLPSRSQAHRSNKKSYPAQPYGVVPPVQMRRSSATPHVPPYMKQMSTPAKFEQHSGRMGRGKYVPTPSVPGIPSPLPEQKAV